MSCWMCTGDTVVLRTCLCACILHACVCSCLCCSLHQQQVVAQLRTALSTLTTVSERRDELEERVQTQDRMVADVREAVKELRGVLEKRGHSFSKVRGPRATLIQP